MPLCGCVLRMWCEHLLRAARMRVEARLAERLPTLAATLAGPEQAEVVVDWP